VVEAYILPSMLVNNPSSVGMVPVSPHRARSLRPQTPIRPFTQRRGARHELAHAARGEGRAAYSMMQPAGLAMQVR
jgi:hypothetical protein